MPSPPETEILSQLTEAIRSVTEAVNDGELMEEDLPTAADLARKLGYRLENVKKKLRILKEQGLIHAVSMTPKRYRFDVWALKNLEKDNVLYELFCEPDSPHYIPTR